jgi:hypothetical protein
MRRLSSSILSEGGGALTEFGAQWGNSSPPRGGRPARARRMRRSRRVGSDRECWHAGQSQFGRDGSSARSRASRACLSRKRCARGESGSGRPGTRGGRGRLVMRRAEQTPRVRTSPRQQRRWAVPPVPPAPHPLASVPSARRLSLRPLPRESGGYGGHRGRRARRTGAGRCPLP